jgi:protoporphyrinogen oxidase
MHRRRAIKTIATGMASVGLLFRAGASSAEGTEPESGFDTVIIGGGIAGLTAAYVLAERNITVLEAEQRVGGRAITGTRGGWSYAKGTEYLGAPEGIFAEIVEELGLTPVEIPAPMDIGFRGGHFHAGSGAKSKYLIDQGGLETYNRFLRTLMQINEDYAPVPEHDPNGPLAWLDDITARAWFEKLGLPEVYHTTYNVMARGLFGATLDEVSALGAFEEIAFDFEGAEPLEDMDDARAMAREAAPSGAYTFKTGITEVSDAIAEYLGDRLRAGARATRITGDDEDGYVVRYVDGDGKTHALEADSVIVATPTPITLEIADAVLSAEQKGILARIPYAPYITAAIFSDRPIFDKGFDLAVPDGWFITDLYDSTWVQRHLDPAADGFEGAVASLYIAPKGYKDAEFLTLSDQEIMRRGLSDLDRIFPGASARVTGFDIHRHRYAYPVATLGAFARLTRLHRTLTGGMQLAGDGVNYPTYQTAIMSGEVAAQRLIEFL